jgi:hypothetical protein
MRASIEPKEKIVTLMKEMTDFQLLKVADYMLFLQQNNDDFPDLIKASENTLDFWDNEEDEVWDNV